MGVLEQPTLDSMPILHIVPSLLHLLLGIDNKIMSSFFKCCYERFETLTPEEIEVETLCILAELDCEEKTEQCALLELESQEAVQNRIEFNRNNKGRLNAEKKH